MSAIPRYVLQVETPGGQPLWIARAIELLVVSSSYFRQFLKPFHQVRIVRVNRDAPA